MLNEEKFIAYKLKNKTTKSKDKQFPLPTVKNNNLGKRKPLKMWLTFLVLLVAISMVLASCGGDSSDNNQDSQTTVSQSNAGSNGTDNGMPEESGDDTDNSDDPAATDDG